MMVEAFKNNVYDEPSKRIDIEFLDSVIADEIKLAKLPLDYQFLVTDEKNEVIKFKFASKKYNLKLTNKF